MNMFEERRHFLVCALGTMVAACGGGDSVSASTTEPGPVPAQNLTLALSRIDQLVTDLMSSTGVPGLAVAVVQGEQKLYAKGFGVKEVGGNDPVDPDTVFQLASMSKSVGATVVAHQVGKQLASWEQPIRKIWPWFTLSDPTVSDNVTIGDLYAHRSGLPDHIGDRLEDVGYSQREILERLRFIPLGGFRTSYAYTNFGLTAAGIAVADRAQTDWATLSEQTIYTPLGMTRTSSRNADFVNRVNRVTAHRKIDGTWQVINPMRMPDAQAPAASVTSSVNDLAKWLSMVLGRGVFAGQRIVDATALSTALSPQMQTAAAANGRPASYYGYGFNVGTSSAGRRTYSHSGAFGLGTATAFRVVPSANLGIVVLTNGHPIGVPEVLVAQLFDLLEHGSIQHDYMSHYADVLATVNAPEGSLVGAPRPSAPAPAQALSSYVGVYQNDYHGALSVEMSGAALVMKMGPTPLTLPLEHWDGDVFTFQLTNENAPPGTISKATFTGNQVTLEYYDKLGLGTFVR